MKNYLELSKQLNLETKYFEGEKYSPEQQEKIFKCLSLNIPIEETPNPELSAEEILFSIISDNLDLKRESLDGLTEEELLSIVFLVNKGYGVLDLINLIKTHGHKEGGYLLDSAERALNINVIELLKEGYDFVQIMVIRESESYGIEVLDWIDPTFDPDQIEQIAEGLGDGIDVSDYNDPSIPRDEMEEIRMELAYC